jgi:hypothetical protein
MASDRTFLATAIYCLHAGRTKTGKRRYFVAKTVGAGALAELPAGFEIVESVNAVVSVRRIDPSARKVPEADLARIRAELANYPGLRRYRAVHQKAARDSADIVCRISLPRGGLRGALAPGHTTSSPVV